MMKKTISFFSTLALFQVSCGSAFKFSGTSGLLSDAFEPLRDVFKASDTEESLIVYLTEDSGNMTDIAKLIGIQSSGVSFFEVGAGKGYSKAVLHLRQLQETSKFPFLVVASDKRGFLASLVEFLYRDHLLVWSTKVLVVTRLTFEELLLIRETLAMVNGMVLSKKEDADRWCLHIYLPYSWRGLEIATWKKHNGFSFLTTYGMFPEKFSRLIDGAHLITTAEVYPPHLMEKEEEEYISGAEGDVGNPFRGPVVDILNILSYTLNFTYTVIRPPDGAYGVRLQNGTWTGMIGMQKKKEVDFSFAPFNILYARAQVVDYTSPFVIEYGRIVARKGEVEANPFGFLLPLTLTVWILLLLALVLVIVVSCLLSFILTKSEPSTKAYSPGNYVRIFLVQDSDEPSVRENSRSILVATWMMAMLIVMESYAGNLRSLLIARHIPQPYHSVREVVDDPSVTVLWVAGTAYHQILESFDSGVFKELADAGDHGKIYFIESTEFYEVIDSKVSKGGYVLMSEELTLRILVSSHFSETGSCSFYLSREAFFPLMTAMTTQKYSPLMKPLNQRVVMMTEAGLYEHWVAKETINYISCVNSPTKILFQSPLSLQSLWGIFIIWAAGCFLGLVIFCMEMLLAKLMVTLL